MDKVMKKKDLAQYLFTKNIEIFQCPICDRSFRKDTLEGLKCETGHNFDLARNGYLNLLTSKQNSDYTRDLFEARRKVFEAGIYQPIFDEIGEILHRLGRQTPIIVDAGCGEGSLLASLQKGLHDSNLVGLDISREGVRFAASQSSPIMWCVADLAKIPMAEGSVDIILNMLSPANYGEFKRVLKPQGYLIKIIPGSQYLQELRDRLEDLDKYSNEAVFSVLQDNMKIIARESMLYSLPVSPGLWPEIVKMTPLTGHKEVSGKAGSQLTIDLEIILTQRGS